MTVTQNTDGTAIVLPTFTGAITMTLLRLLGTSVGGPNCRYQLRTHGGRTHVQPESHIPSLAYKHQVRNSGERLGYKNCVQPRGPQASAGIKSREQVDSWTTPELNLSACFRVLICGTQWLLSSPYRTQAHKPRAEDQLHLVCSWWARGNIVYEDSIRMIFSYSSPGTIKLFCSDLDSL